MSMSLPMIEVSDDPTERTDDHGLVLVVDDDRAIAQLTARWLEREGFRVATHSNAESLFSAFAETLPDAVCLDLGLPGMSGQDALAQIRKHHSTVPVIVVTGERKPETVVAAMQGGAYDYLAKPLERTKYVASVRNAVERHRLSTKVRQLERDSVGAGFAGLVGRSPAMRSLYRQLDRIAASDITVLVHGESGTGKELVTRAIHDNSARRDGPLVAVNCAAIPQSLQDAELFGHEKGAFTGADQARPGRFEQADGGTLFLDEVAELSLPLQAKLLRVLQERTFERVGGRKTMRTDFRLVAATHRDLSEMVARGEFREDLFFRLAVLELQVPPLRERTGDVELLTHRFLSELSEGEVPELTDAARDVLLHYAWPGNVRELRNALQRAIVVCDASRIDVGDFPPRLRAAVEPTLASAPVSLPTPAAPANQPPPTAVRSLADLERSTIEEALQATGGNVSEVTRRLGISRATLYRRLKKYGLR